MAFGIVSKVTLFVQGDIMNARAVSLTLNLHDIFVGICFIAFCMFFFGVRDVGVGLPSG